MKRLFLFLILLSLCCPSISARFDLRTAMPLADAKTLPFSSNSEFLAEYALDNPDNIIPDKIYKNFQLTDFSRVRDFPNTDLGLILCFKSHMGNDVDLALVMVSGISDPSCYILISVDDNFQIIDTLEAGINFGNIPVRQFYATENKEVFVYQLVPSTTTSIPLETFRYVDAYITETVYQIDSAGKFIKMSEKRTPNSRTYTREQLDNKETCLWDLFNAQY